MVEKDTTEKPICFQCNKPLLPRYHSFPKTMPKILTGYGHHCNNCFCSQRCGFSYALDLILSGRGKCPEHNELVEERRQHVRKYNAKAMKERKQCLV